jgi:hypothetical protein
MLHPSKARVKTELARLARPVGAFSADRYFHGDHGLRFYNVGTAPMRALAKTIFRSNRDRWVAADALAFASTLIRDPYLETKSIVGLIPPARRHRALDLLYANARALHGDDEDLIQKAVGWALREAGKADMKRLERYLRDDGTSIPRTTCDTLSSGSTP